MYFYSNLAIAAAYGTFSLATLYGLHNMQLRGAAQGNAVLLSAFVASCGIGHWLMALSSPWVGISHVFTAGVSWAAAARLLQSYNSLKAQIAAPKETEAILRYVAAEPWGVWKVATDSEGRPDLLCCKQSPAAIAETGEMVGRLLGEAMPGHRSAIGYRNESLLDSYLAVATGERSSHTAEIQYQGTAADGKLLNGWYRLRVQNIGPGRVFLTWADISEERKDVDGRLRSDAAVAALARKEYVLYYQPIYRLDNQELVGFEALIRWPAANGTLRSPAEFLPLLDRGGYAVEVFFYTLELALEAIQKIPAPLKICINLSPDVLGAEIFPERMFAMCRRYLVPFERIAIEITEQTALTLPVLPKLAEVSGAGYRIAIDDMGSGEANLSGLVLLSEYVQLVKLDRSLVAGTTHNDRQALVAAGAIKLLKGLGLEIVAEGLEEAEEIELMRQLGCDYGQGYKLGRPMPLSDAIALTYKDPASK